MPEDRGVHAACRVRGDASLSSVSRGLRLRRGLLRVLIERGVAGGWLIMLPDDHGRVLCETPDDARRIGYLCATHGGHALQVVRDAYHGVIDRERIESAPPSVLRDAGGC